MRIFAFPYKGPAYNESFYSAVGKKGVSVLQGEWAGRWLYNNIKRDDVVHFHWPSFLYSSSTRRFLIRNFLKFIVLVALVRCKTRRLCWTAHNLLPHEYCAIPLIDILARHAIILSSSKIFVHGAEAERLLVKRFPLARRKCVRIPHGNWIDRYPPKLTRGAAREQLGIPDYAFVILFFGQIRPYKNLEGLVQAFKVAAAANDILLVAGRTSDEDYRSRIAALAGSDSRIRIDNRFIPDDEVSSYVAASNIMCMPYQEVLTSGTAILSLSLGRPAISIDRGFLRDIITIDSGILIEPKNDQALVDSLQRARVTSWSEAKIVAQASRFTFDEAAEIFLREFE